MAEHTATWIPATVGGESTKQPQKNSKKHNKKNWKVLEHKESESEWCDYDHIPKISKVWISFFSSNWTNNIQ